MRITYLELENIKSYAGLTRIEFSEGLNSISGHNGSGKSTVLEAIGWVLFNALPYKRDAFTREGQRSGTVRVGLIGADGREYEVTRRTQPAAYHVTDLETGTRLASSNEAVPWIRSQGLNLDGDIDLKTLFETSVGVPQGTMTADFLKTGQNRKNVFDPLLRVEEYRHAWEELRASASLLDSRVAAISADIEHLSESTARLPDVQAELATAEDTLTRLRLDLENASTELAQLRLQQNVLDEAERTLAELSRTLRDAEHQMSLLSVERDQRGRDQQRAREAQIKVTASSAGHASLVAARQRLADLETERRQREQVNERLFSARGELDQVSGTIEQLERQRTDAIAAAAEAATLVAVVQEQTELEGRRGRAQLVIATQTALERRIFDQQAQIDRLESDIQGSSRKLLVARAATDRLAGMINVQAELEQTSAALAELGPLKREMETVAGDGKRLREQQRTLQANVQRWRELRSEQNQVEVIAARCNDLQTRVQELRDEQMRIVAAVDYQGQARAALMEHLCPLLDVQCPALVAQPTLVHRFDERDREFADRRASLTAEQTLLLPKARDAEKARERLHVLQIEVAALEASVPQLEEIEARLSACLTRYRELETQVNNAPALERRQAELRTAQEEARRDETAAAVIPELDAQLRRDGAVLITLQATMAELTAERHAMRADEEMLLRTESELEALGNPRERQQALLNTAAAQSKIETDLLVQHTRQVAAAALVKTILDESHRFDGLDQQFDDQSALVTKHQGAYDTYVRERPIADTFPACEAAAAEVDVRLARARAAEADVRGRLEAAQRMYDSEVHQRVRTEVFAAEGRRAAQAERETHQETEVKRVRLEAQRLATEEERREKRVAERLLLERTRTVLKFVRETIKEAGPAVTGALLRNISEGANEIYAEIMDDHAIELRWDDEYDIVVRRGADDRTFAQLSGGEQMSAALAVRLALLKEMSDVDFAFFDEPTQNMDQERRTNLADQIGAVRGFEQLIVISHDDTFEHHTDTLIRLQKIDGETTLVDRLAEVQ